MLLYLYEDNFCIYRAAFTECPKKSHSNGEEVQDPRSTNALFIWLFVSRFVDLTKESSLLWLSSRVGENEESNFYLVN